MYWSAFIEFEFVESEQEAAFMHGADKHSSTSASQLKPV